MPSLDTESYLVPWAAAALPDVHCCTEIPDDLAAELPLLQIAGIGGASGHRFLGSPMVDFDAFGADRISARALAWRAFDLLRETLATDVGPVSHVTQISSPAWRPYNNTAVRRYGFTLLLKTRTH